FVVALPEITIGNTTATQNTIAAANPSFAPFEIILLTGIVISTMLFLWKLYKIRQLKRKGKIEILDNITIVHLPKSTEAFSFAEAIFLGEQISIHSKEQIVRHEQVHIKQKHYADLLYFELLRILFWFNPLIYIFQKRTATLHEYIADAETVSVSDKKEYYQNLLSEVFQTRNISFINTFFNHSLIKKRIVMLQKSKSKKSQLVKYLLLFPLMAAMLCVSSCEQRETETQQKADEVIQKTEAVENLPIAVIDEVPIYPGCENLTTNEERKQCMSEKISNHVVENFNAEIGKKLELEGRVRISLQFKIDKEGSIVDVMARAPHYKLEEEAKRVINLLPQMQPGKQEGKEVGVLYALPIIFEL
ncbi:MAG: M56 family metallopeptidase, partial [Vicingaceae bacterium]